MKWKVRREKPKGGSRHCFRTSFHNRLVPRKGRIRWSVFPPKVFFLRWALFKTLQWGPWPAKERRAVVVTLSSPSHKEGGGIIWNWKMWVVSAVFIRCQTASHVLLAHFYKIFYSSYNWLSWQILLFWRSSLSHSFIKTEMTKLSDLADRGDQKSGRLNNQDFTRRIFVLCYHFFCLAVGLPIRK